MAASHPRTFPPSVPEPTPSLDPAAVMAPCVPPKAFVRTLIEAHGRDAGRSGPIAEDAGAALHGAVQTNARVFATAPAAGGTTV